MAGKTLYEILGVARNAAPEVLEAAYRAQREQLDKAPKKEATAALAFALEEAYKTLSNPQLRAVYDRRLHGAPAATISAAAPIDDRSWLARNLTPVLVLICVVAASAYLYDSHRREALQTKRALEEQQKRLKAEKAELEAKEAERQRAENEAKERTRAQQEYIWEQQVRARANMLARQEEYRRAMDQAQAQRQRQQEEMRQRQEDLQANIRLQQEKQKLHQLQCANGAC